MGLLSRDRHARRRAEETYAQIDPAVDDALFGSEPAAQPDTLAAAHPAAADLPSRDFDPAESAMRSIADGADQPPALEPPAPTQAPAPSPAQGMAYGRMLANPMPPQPEHPMVTQLADPWVTERMPPPMAAPPAPVAPAPNTDLTSGVAGVDGIHDYDFEALPRETSPGDLPVRRPGAASPSALAARRGRMPGGPSEAGGPLPDLNAETYGMAPDADPVLPGRWRDDAPGDPPDAETHGMATDADPTLPGSFRASPPDSASRTMAMLSEARRLGSPQGESRFSMTQPPRDAKPPVDAARAAAAGPLPRLDAGLPSEEDIAGAREGAGDSFLRHLQNGLRGALGMDLREAPTTADDLAAERRAGLRGAMASKGASRVAERSAAHTAERQARTDSLAERGLAIRQQQADASTLLAQPRADEIHARTERTQAATEAAQLATQFSRATREERQSAASQLSRGYQQAINATLSGMGAMGDRFRGELTSPIEQQSAEQLEPLLRRVQSLGLRAGAGGGGSGGSIDDLRARAVAHGVDAEDAAVLPASDLRREIGEDTGPTARAAHDRAGGGSRVSVWENAEGTPVTASPDAFSTPTEERTYRNALEDAGRISTLLDAIDSAYREAGGGATLGSRTAAAASLAASGAIQQPIGSMLGAISDYLTHTGVVNPGGEAERLMGMLPNPTSSRQILTGSYDAQAAQFRGTIADMVRRDARQRGVSDEDAARLLRELGLGSHTAGAHARRSAPQAPTPTAPAAAPAAPAAPDGAAGITMTRPDGQRVHGVPPGRVQALTQLGWVTDGP